MKEKYLKPSNIKNFQIDHSICTETASFLIGDKDSIDKERKKYDILEKEKKSHLYDHNQFDKYIIADPSGFYRKAPLYGYENYEREDLNLDREFFMIKLGGDFCIPFFLFVFNKEVDSFFWPSILINNQEGFINDSKEWNENNIAIKKLILNHLSENKSKWLKIGQLNIPSKKLLIQEAHFSDKEYYLTHESKNKFDIFAVYSVKRDLYKIYSDPEWADFIKENEVKFSTDHKQISEDATILYGLFFKSK